MFISRPTFYFLAVMLLAPSAHSEQAVAVLDLRFVKDTGQPGAVVCEGEDDCVVWSTDYIFEAKVKQLISGDLPQERFFLRYAQHALKKKNFRNVVARLEKREVDGDSDVHYRMIQWGEKRDLYCFADRDDNHSGFDVEVETGENLNCHEAD